MYNLLDVSPLKADIPFFIPTSNIMRGLVFPTVLPINRKHFKSLYFCQSNKWKIFFRYSLICISLTMCQVEHHKLSTFTFIFLNTICISGPLFYRAVGPLVKNCMYWGYEPFICSITYKHITLVISFLLYYDFCHAKILYFMALNLSVLYIIATRCWFMARKVFPIPNW